MNLLADEAADELVVGVVGCGYWGPNHIRNMLALKPRGVDMRVAADRDPLRRHRVTSLFPSVAVVEEARDIISDPKVDAIVIATPVTTHFELAKAALEAGKHVLVEKPMVTSVPEGEALIALAEANGLTLMVGHTFEYTAAVERIRQLIGEGTLGEILYVRSMRVNLGLYQRDINVMWDLAPHDLSILHYVLDSHTTHVTATGKAHMNAGVEDIVTLNLEFESEALATVLVSWLDPRKVREMTFVGTKRMLVYDDISAGEKIRIYDKGVDAPAEYDSFGEFQMSYRYGDITIPKLDDYEPLREQSNQFIDCIIAGKTPRSDGRSGLAVVRALAAGQVSLGRGGGRVPVADPDVRALDGRWLGGGAR